MLTCISLMELVQIAIHAHFPKLQYMRHINLGGTIGEGENFESFLPIQNFSLRISSKVINT